MSSNIIQAIRSTYNSSSPLRPVAAAAGFLAVLLVALALPAVAAAHSPRVIGIGQKHNKDSVTVNVGDTLVVTLPAKPSTGYSWRVVQMNRHQLRPAGGGYVRASAPPLAQDATGITILVFKVAATGSSTLRIDYVSTVKSNPITRHFVVRVTIKPPDG